MPTYEYACKSCGEHLEVVQSFSDEALTTCPACGGPLRKVFSSIGISFKGSGFYRTDSRPAATKKEKDRETAKEKSAASAKDGASGKDGAASKDKTSAGSSSESSSTKSDGSSSKSGGSDKATAAAAPASS